MQISPIYVVPDNASVWLVYPGRNRSHYNIFRENNIIFLEIPGYSANNHTFKRRKSIELHLAMSKEISAYNKDKSKEIPSRDPLTYEQKVKELKKKDKRSFTAMVGNISRMYRQAKVNDIVLCPGYRNFQPWLVGIIEDNWAESDTITLKEFDLEPVPYRSVRWLDSIVTRNSFRPSVARQLQNQHAISKLDQSLYNEIFQKSLGNYVYKNHSNIKIVGYNYNSNDPEQALASIKLIRYAIALSIHFIDNKNNSYTLPNYEHFTQAFYRKELIDHFGINFNSPGIFSILFNNPKIAPLVATAILALTSCTDSKHSITKDDIENLATNAISNNLQGEDQLIKNFVNSLSIDEISKASNEIQQESSNPLQLSLNQSGINKLKRSELEEGVNDPKKLFK